VSYLSTQEPTLDDVTRRFVESEQALSEVRDRLEGLRSAGERADAARNSLESAAAAAEAFVAVARDVAEGLRGLQEQARINLQTATELFSGDEIAALRAEVSQLDATTTERIDGLRADVQQLIAALPERWRKRITAQ